MGVIPLDLAHSPLPYSPVLCLFVGLAFILVSVLICGCCRKKKGPTIIPQVLVPVQHVPATTNERSTLQFKIEVGKEVSDSSSLTPKEAASHHKDAKSGQLGSFPAKGKVSNKSAKKAMKKGKSAAPKKLKSGPKQMKKSMMKKIGVATKANPKGIKVGSPSGKALRPGSPKNTITFSRPPSLTQTDVIKEAMKENQPDPLMTSAIRLATTTRDPYIVVPLEGPNDVDPQAPGIIPPILQRPSPVGSTPSATVVDDGHYLYIDQDPEPEEKSQSIMLAAAKQGSLVLQSKYDAGTGTLLGPKPSSPNQIDSQMVTLATTSRLPLDPKGKTGRSRKRGKIRKKIRKKDEVDLTQSLMLQSIDVQPRSKRLESPNT